MPLLEKFLSEKLNKPLKTGSIFFIKPDKVLLCDALGHHTLNNLKQLGGKYEFPFSQVYATCGKSFLPRDIETANLFKVYKSFVKEFNLNFLGPDKAGVLHNVFAENVNINIGEVIVGTDSHTLTAGAFGALGIGVGITEMVAILKYGKTWFQIPQSIKVKLYNKPISPVTIRDVMFHFMKRIAYDGVLGKIVEFWDYSKPCLDVDEKMMLTSLTAELGVVSTLFAPENMEQSEQTQDTEYQKVYDIDMKKISEPMVAWPHHPFNLHYLSESVGVPIDSCFIGTCSGGGLTGLRQAAYILKDQYINDNVVLVITPQSQNIYLNALKEGLIDIFITAGAVVTFPTCGACMASHSGVLPYDSKCISTGNRNFQGRMGDPTSQIFLASPATVSLAAIFGEIRTFNDFNGEMIF